MSEDIMDKGVSLFSQLYHFFVYSIKKPKMQLEKGMLIISIDVDVGSRELGVINRGKNDANVNDRISEYQIGKIEEVALPLFIETFNEFQTPVTFALRGQLTEINHSILENLLNSSVEHDMGAHGYYHREFTNLSCNEAETELNMLSAGLKKFGIIPRSFVFPKNSVAHLNLLEKYGYKCYRGYGGFMNDCMYIEKQRQLCNVHPSLYIDQGASFAFLKRCLDISIAKQLPFHVWFHLWNFGETKELIERSIKKWLLPFLEHAQKNVNSERLTFETMLSASEEVEKFNV